MDRPGPRWSGASTQWLGSQGKGLSLRTAANQPNPTRHPTASHPLCSSASPACTAPPLLWFAHLSHGMEPYVLCSSLWGLSALDHMIKNRLCPQSQVWCLQHGRQERTTNHEEQSNPPNQKCLSFPMAKSIRPDIRRLTFQSHLCYFLTVGPSAHYLTSNIYFIIFKMATIIIQMSKWIWKMLVPYTSAQRQAICPLCMEILKCHISLE